MPIINGMGEHTYHAHSALSSTGARLILDSPARYRYRTMNPRRSDTFDLGTAVHTRVLGVGRRVITYPPEHLTPSGNASTKAVTVAWVEEQRANGWAVVSEAQARLVEGMAEAVLAHPTARGLLEQPGAAEVSVFGTDPDTGVDLRARFDYLPSGDGPIRAVDLKSATSASSRAFARAAALYEYEVQDAHYLHTLGIARGHQDAELVFVVVEREAPHFVAVHQLDEQFAEIGRGKARRAREIYRRCLDTDTWPAYPVEITQLSPPAWAVYEYQDQYEPEMVV